MMNNKIYIAFSSVIAALLLLSISLQTYYFVKTKPMVTYPDIGAEFVGFVKRADEDKAKFPGVSGKLFSAAVKVTNKSNKDVYCRFAFNGNKYYKAKDKEILFLSDMKTDILKAEPHESLTYTLYFSVDSSISDDDAIYAIENCDFEYMYGSEDSFDFDNMRIKTINFYT